MILTGLILTGLILINCIIGLVMIFREQEDY